MAFKAFSHEDQVMCNSGPVYVFENSRWTYITEKRNFKSGQDDTRHKGLSTICHEEDSQTTQKYIPVELTRACDGLHVPPRLLSLCTDFVAGHIHLVESLVDFPEIVGKSLFFETEKKQKFEDLECQDTMLILHLFSDAYGTAMLESLDLSDAWHVITPILNILGTVFLHITSLNLAGCQLGEDTDLLQQFSKMVCLQRLGLQNNGLTDDSIRLLTLPLRLLLKGPRKLNILDLSCNPKVGNSAARYLFCFPCLIRLDLSGTGFKGGGIQTLKDKLSLEEDPNPTMCSVASPWVSRGWCAEAIAKWLRTKVDKIHSVTEEKTKMTNSSNPASFYGNKQRKAKRWLSEPQRVAQSQPRPPPEPVLVLRRHTPNNPLVEFRPTAIRPESKSKQTKVAYSREVGRCELMEEHRRPVLAPQPEISSSVLAGYLISSGPLSGIQGDENEHLPLPNSASTNQPDLLEQLSKSEKLTSKRSVLARVAQKRPCPESDVSQLESSDISDTLSSPSSNGNTSFKSKQKVANFQCGLSKKRRKIVVKRPTEVKGDPAGRVEERELNTKDAERKRPKNANMNGSSQKGGHIAKKQSLLLSAMDW